MNQQSRILVINKPKGVTSHDVVDEVRKITGIKKVGHAGTLDPTATGVLVVLVGWEATKQSDKLRGQDKEYIVEMEFGRTTDTLDQEGKISHQLAVHSSQLRTLTQKDIQEVLSRFRGTYEQEVPMYSAVKVDGVKLYEIARGSKKKPDGFNVPSRKVEIKELELLDYKIPTDGTYPTAKLRAVVSSGTYTRALVRDIGDALGVPAHQTALTRIRSGQFSLDEAVTVKELRGEVKEDE